MRSPLAALALAVAALALAAGGAAGSLRDPRINTKEGVVSGTRRRYGPLVDPGRLTRRALVGRRARGADVEQSYEGPCFFDGVLAPYAEFKPQVIDGLFFLDDGRVRRSRSGSPQMRFFAKIRGTTQFRPELVAYSGRVPMRNGEPALNPAVGGKPWSPLAEVGYTKWRDQQGSSKLVGYRRTYAGGQAHHVMSAITGRPAFIYPVTSANVAALLPMVRAALAAGQIVALGTSSDGTLFSRRSYALARGLIPRTSSGASWNSRRMWPLHVYSVWGSGERSPFFVRDGVEYIRLRDTLGLSPKGRGRKGVIPRQAYGVGGIPVHELGLFVDRIYIGA
jgi:hypothetical protein